MARHVPLPVDRREPKNAVTRKVGDASMPERTGGRPLFSRINFERAIILGTLFMIGVLPIALYAGLFAGLPAVSPPQARQRLAASDEGVVLVDVRDAGAFARGHVDGATNWPYQEIRQQEAASPLPREVVGKELLLLSGDGLQGALAARYLATLPLPVSYIHGGLQAWIASAAQDDLLDMSLWRGPSSQAGPLPAQVLTPSEHLVTVTASVLIKPIYMIASLLLIIVLWSNRAAELRVLRWGLIFFLVGEIACVFNTTSYFTNGQQSDLFEYLHGLGMVLFLWLAVCALVQGLERRVIHATDAGRRCAMLPICRSCYKTQDVPCSLKRVYLLIVPTMMLLGLIPLSAQPDAVSINVRLFTVPFNFSHPGIHQIYEIRYLPLVALGLLSAALLILLFNRREPMTLAMNPFAAGVGCLGYSLLMLTLYATFRNNLVWFIFWEEGTELLLITMIGAALWIFRRGLFPALTSAT